MPFRETSHVAIDYGIMSCVPTLGRVVTSGDHGGRSFTAPLLVLVHKIDCKAMQIVPLSGKQYDTRGAHLVQTRAPWRAPFNAEDVLSNSKRIIINVDLIVAGLSPFAPERSANDDTARPPLVGHARADSSPSHAGRWRRQERCERDSGQFSWRSQDGLVHHRSSVEAKIALFRSLFRGRDDVYPRRFESRKTGKSGYQPACANEWARGLCEKPKVKCAACPHRRFLPVTDDVIRWHLSGRDDDGRDFVMGVYPMLQDETCFFLAADFDKTHWQEDARAFLETCRQMNLPAALERSRSGNGGHIWLFFQEAIPAALARKLGSHILTETMERRPDIGLDSYDRFFPNQDTLPQGGFGNLIALPLQKQPRELGNSVFLDRQCLPYPDQWAFLSTVPKIERSTVEEIVRDAEGKGRVVGVRLALADEDDDCALAAPPSRRRKEPPIAGPLPKSLELILGDQIYIAKDQLPPGLRNRLVRLAAFQNPEFYKAQAMRLPTYDKPRIIGCAEDHAHHIGLPRGCLEDVQQASVGLAHRRRSFETNGMRASLWM